ncbi:hypothetical protein ACFFX0_11195 [Citricoccus parietis]|uniref:Uncharacterized protein n=1 Tax=Citricoccus parietis TaxID=592307 RepID=A0ABV5FYH8_9MICC
MHAGLVTGITDHRAGRRPSSASTFPLNGNAERSTAVRSPVRPAVNPNTSPAQPSGGLPTRSLPP